MKRDDTKKNFTALSGNDLATVHLHYLSFSCFIALVTFSEICGVMRYRSVINALFHFFCSENRNFLTKTYSNNRQPGRQFTPEIELPKFIPIIRLQIKIQLVDQLVFIELTRTKPMQYIIEHRRTFIKKQITDNLFITDK